MIKLIAIDLDGTLVNTLPDLLGAVNSGLIKTNHEPITMEQVVSFVGNGVVRLVEKALGPENLQDLDEAYAEFLNYYSTHLTHESFVYDGIYPLLSYLKDNNYKLAVVSNKLDAFAKTIVEYFFPNTFDCVIGELEKTPRKPAPDMLELALKSLNINKDEVVFVGDSAVDYQTYTNANVIGTNCSWGFVSLENLKSLNIENIINHPSELIDFINKFNL